MKNLVRLHLLFKANRMKETVISFITILIMSVSGLSAQQTNNCLSFDGVNDYVSTPNNALIDFNNGNSYTIEAWIKVNKNVWLGGIVSKYNTNKSNGYVLRLGQQDPDSISLNFDEMETPTGIIQPGVWYHVAAVNNAGERQLYLNGVKQTLMGVALTVQSNTDPLSIGSDYSESGTYARLFNGNIDEVRIWNVARTQAEIQGAMNIELTGNERGLVAYYNFNQGISNGNNTTITALNTIPNSPVLDGNIKNFALTGTISNFTAGGPALPVTPDVNGVLHVKKGANGNGTSWANAVGELTLALNATQPNSTVKEIWVSKGVYQPEMNSAFRMVEGVKIYGHFAGKEESLSQRNLMSTDTTFLKGNGANVIYNDANGLTAAAVLDGFTITEGIGSSGAGIHNIGTSPTYSNCVVKNNISSNMGGGISIVNSSSVLKNIVFSNNSATLYGGGVYIENSFPKIVNCKIEKNNSAGGGGVDLYKNSIGTFVNCTLTENNSAVLVESGTTLKAYNTIILENTEGVKNDGGTLDLQYSLIQGFAADAAKFNLDGNTITAAQVFNSPSTEDYTLKTGSPVINKGSNTLYTAAGGNLTTDKDLAGKPRLNGTTIDMGAYEFIDATGIFNPTSETLSFYPNPVKDVIHLSGTGENAKVSVLDVTGKLLIETELNLSTVDVSDLKAGIYVIKVSDAKGTRAGKFMKK